MAEKVARVGIKRDSNRMYFIKGTTVYSVPRGKKGAAHKKEASFNHERDNDYIYFVDKNGDVARAKRKTRKGSKKRKAAKRKSAGRKSAGRKPTKKRKSAKRKSAKKVAKKAVTARRKTSGLPAAPKRKAAKKAPAKKSDRKAMKKVLNELKSMGKRLSR